MEPDLHVTVKGVREDVAQDIGEALASVIRVLATKPTPLDLRRMRRVVATADFGAELAEISKTTASGNPIDYTNEQYAQAVAKVLLLPSGDDIEIVPVFSAAFLVPLTKDPESEEFAWMVHMVHHEMCHVHDNNKKLDALHEFILRHRYSGKDKYIRALSESCWSEYIANRLSSPSAPECSITTTAETLADAIERTKPLIDREILSYRWHGDLDVLLNLFQRHGEFLAKSAAYVLGYIDGLDASLEKIAPKVSQLLSGSYFEDTWNQMQSALRQMFERYPEGWTDLSVYDELSRVMDAYYGNMGLLLSTTADGGVYVGVPFRPETNPDLLPKPEP